MNRRAFLSLLAGAAVAPAVVPLARVWSFPSLLARLFPWRRTEAGVLFPETVTVVGPDLITPGVQYLDTVWITEETLRILKNNLNFEAFASSDWEQRFRKFARGSSRLSIALPQRFRLVADSPAPFVPVDIDSAGDDEFAGIDDVNEYG